MIQLYPLRVFSRTWFVLSHCTLCEFSTCTRSEVCLYVIPAYFQSIYWNDLSTCARLLPVSHILLFPS